MRARHNPQVFNKKTLYIKRKEVGYIQLVQYYQKNSRPHIEYTINEEFRNQGIMKKELPKYLKICKKHDLKQIVAIVELDNVISQKLLENNGFIKMMEGGDFVSYIIDMNMSKDDMKIILKHMAQNRAYGQRIKELHKKNDIY